MRLEARAVAVMLADGGVAADMAVGGGNVGPVLMPSRMRVQGSSGMRRQRW